MSEERNDAGQFSGTPEILTGQAAALRDAGFVEMPDPEKKAGAEAIDGDSKSINEAAKLLNKPAPPIIERSYLKGDAEPVDPNEAISLERAARDLTATRQKEAEEIEAEKSKEIADEADKLRGKDTKTDEPKDEGAKSTKAEDSEPVAESDLDAKIEEALSHPQIRQAIEEHVNVAETSRKAYADALTAVTDIARVTFFDQFPEFASIGAEQMPAALNQLAQQDPAKFQRVTGLLNRIGQFASAQQHEQQKQAAVARQQFVDYAKAEDAKAESFLKSETPQARAQIENEILAAVKEYAGLEPGEFVKLFQTDATVRNAGFQRFMVDAAKYRLMMKASKAVATRQVPPVQRPGVSRSGSDTATEKVRQLSEKFNSKPSLKNAADMLAASRRVKARA